MDEAYVTTVDEFVRHAADILQRPFPDLAEKLRATSSVADERAARQVEWIGYRVMALTNVNGRIRNPGANEVGAALARCGEHSYDGYPISQRDVDDVHEATVECHREGQRFDIPLACSKNHEEET